MHHESTDEIGLLCHHQPGPSITCSERLVANKHQNMTTSTKYRLNTAVMCHSATAVSVLQVDSVT